MGIIGWVLLGFFAGVLARLILPRNQPGGVIVTTLIGIAGALVAGFIARSMGYGDPIDEFFDLSTWVAAIIGSVLLLLLWGLIAGSRGPRRRIIR